MQHCDRVTSLNMHMPSEIESQVSSRKEDIKSGQQHIHSYKLHLALKCFFQEKVDAFHYWHAYNLVCDLKKRNMSEEK